LQKLEGFAGMNASQLLELATKVFYQSRSGGYVGVLQDMKKKTELLAAVLGG
jgi:hypothetical protein